MFQTSELYHQEIYERAGVNLYAKLQWFEQVVLTIQKANLSLNELKIIRKHFSTNELIKMVTSNYFLSFDITLKFGTNLT
jgi:hypothetical protein